MFDPVPVGTRVFVLITRRSEVLVVRDSQGLYDLPGGVVAPNENFPEVLARIVASMAGGDVCSAGSKIPLDLAQGVALCVPVLTKRSAFENWTTTDLGLTWLSRRECEEKPEICAEALAALRFPDNAGNEYALGETSQGTPTFFHLATGETLHGQVGPWEEAQNLYIPLSLLHSRTGEVVVHDLGLGCGTLALAAIDAFLKNPGLQKLQILSYDLEVRGIEALIENAAKFPFALPFVDMLEHMASHGTASLTTPDGRRATWHFIRGDYGETSRQQLDVTQKANVIFLDFFSPKSHPSLWTFSVMQSVFNNSAEDAILITSSSATSTRAALAAVGFFVGFAPPSGKRSCSTVAARRFEDLHSPLPQTWLKKFHASHAQFCDAESTASKEIIKDNLMKHQQFRDDFLPNVSK